jgi:hypothetical protein
MAEGFKHARARLVLGELLSTVAHHALFFGELLIQQQGSIQLKLALPHDKSSQKKRVVG